MIIKADSIIVIRFEINSDSVILDEGSRYETRIKNGSTVSLTAIIDGEINSFTSKVKNESTLASLISQLQSGEPVTEITL